MKKFRVLLRGENFLLRSEGVVKRFGFYTTRFVEAVDESEAERCAVEYLRQEDRLRGSVLNDPSDPPMIFAEEIDEVPSFDAVEDRSPGLAFYEDQPTAQ
jgi:hypothetical protein